MTIRYSRPDPWNGTYKLVQVEKNPPSWKGRFHRNPNGPGIPVEVRLVQD
jgi:hypothetical protein